MKTPSATAFFSVFFLFLSLQLFSQQISERSYRQLARIGIDTVSLHTAPAGDIARLHEILKKHRQQKAEKITGIIFGTFSGLSLVTGTILLATKSSGEEGGIGMAMGLLSMTAGTIYAGISVPLLIASKKKKRQRDRLIRSFKATH
jgi:uncharacterized membrane protein (DUF485 family)